MNLAAHAERMAWTADEVVMRPRTFTVKREMVSKESVDYRPASSAHHCGNCVMFHESTHKCDLVKGHIEADGVCDKWEAEVAEKSAKAWLDEVRNSRGEWTTVGNTAGVRREIGRQLDAQGVDSENPLRGVLQYNPIGNRKLIHRDEHGNIDAGMDYTFQKRPVTQTHNISVNDLRVLPQRQGIGTRMFQHLAASHPEAKDMAVFNAVSTAIPFYERTGASFGPGSHYGEWNPDAVNRLRSTAQKSRRIVGLNGQETWADGDNGPPYPASGGGASLPPGGVPGATAGGEPPRWDGGQPEPRTESAPDDEDDALAPTEGRVAPASRGGVGFPATYMDGYWPGGGHGTQQAGTSSPGGERGVPPSTVRGKEKVRLSDLVKVGPEGYIHGFICVRPPCGPRCTEAKFDSSKGAVEHEGSRIGKMRKNADGTYSMAHHRGDSTKSKLDAKYASRADAARSVALYHNLDVLHDHAADSGHAEAAAKILKARDALAAGDHDAAQANMVSAELEANKAGDSVLATHLVETRAALVTAPKPVNTPPEPSAADWDKYFQGDGPAPVPVPHVPEGMHDPSQPDGLAPLPAPVHEPEPPAEPEAPRPTVMKSVVPVSKDPPEKYLDALDRLDQLEDKRREFDAKADEYDKAGDQRRRENARQIAYQFQQEAGKLRYGDDWGAGYDAPKLPGSLPAIAEDAGMDNNAQLKGDLLHFNRQFRKDLAEENGLTLEEADRRMVNELKSIAQNGHVASRVTNTSLERILDDNAFKTQFETNRSKALKNNDIRAEHEAAWFGYPENLDPSLRPFYGYVTDGGPDRPVGVGTKDFLGFNTDQLSSFGTTQVIFKDDIKSRTSMNVGDSLNAKEGSMPSPMLEPDARSYAAYDEGKPDPHGGFGRTYKHGLVNASGLRGMNRDYTGGDFRQHTFVEAQIHSPDGTNRPATPADIDRVLFDSPPPKSLRDKLDAKGIPWKVWNAQAIAKSGTPEEKARALEVTNQDIEHAVDQLAFMRKNLAEAEARDRRDEYTINSWKKDITAVEHLHEKLLKAQAALQKAGA